MADNKITHIGKYDVIATIGRGGMGVVYKATDPVLGRIVAIKMMTGGFADDPDLLKRFYREAKSTASLHHPNIVTVYDVGDQDGEPYLVMEFLDGESLDAIIRSQRDLNLLEKIDYIVQVCRGLQYAHERNTIHRDIKPANIMVQREGTVKIVDFGIARMGDDHVTRPGQVMGSIHYMSPEQIGEGDADARTDLFATGIVLYQLLTYHLPFKGGDVPATLFKIIHDPPPPLSHYLKSYPPDLDAIIERALAKDSGDRYQTADELAFDLTQVQLQLKAGLVAELLEKANLSSEQGGLDTARGHLLELLKLDPQNQTANERMRALHKSIQERRRAEQVQQLRKEAEGAAKLQQFEQALQAIEHAISLDHLNVELVSIRDDLNRAKARADYVRDCMKQAQSARSNNDLERALKCLDELLGKEPEHASALALRDEIFCGIAYRERQRQVWNAGVETTGDSLASLSDVTTQEMGSASASPPLRTKPQDKTVLELTPPQGEAVSEQLRKDGIGSDWSSILGTPAQTSEPSIGASKIYGSAMTGSSSAGSASFGNISGWQAETLVRVEKQLAIFLGPLARVFVKKAACKTHDSEELYELLAANLERESDRKAFLAGKAAEVGKNRAESRPMPESTPTNTAPLTSQEFKQADIDHAAHLLARHLGPIAGVLAKRAAQRAGDLRTLYHLLADNLENDTERARFLRDSGFSDL
jgi:serine/threonine protein kinase